MKRKRFSVLIRQKYLIPILSTKQNAGSYGQYSKEQKGTLGLLKFLS